MKREVWRATLAFGLLLLSPTARAAQVVGLHDSYPDVLVAMRGLMPAGSTVRGIEFYSNDATTFPEVLLVSDESASARLPRIGMVLRRLENVVGSAGYVTVEFEPFQVTEDQYLWAVVRFPDRRPLSAAGIGGGPGIGWRERPVLRDERSFFSVMGAMNEFSPAFDISFVTGIGASLKAASGDSPETRPSPCTRLEVRTTTGRPGSVFFRVEVPGAGRLTVDLYSVAGRRVRRLVDSDVQVGLYGLRWDGRDDSGQASASGIYLFRVEATGERRTGKVVLWR